MVKWFSNSFVNTSFKHFKLFQYFKKEVRIVHDTNLRNTNLRDTSCKFD